MSPNPSFRVGVIRPVECFREGWELIKDQYWMFFGVTIVGMLIGGIVPLCIILGAMICGVYYCLFQKAAGRPITFDGLFKGFEYFGPSLVVTMFVIVPAVILWTLLCIPLIVIQFTATDRRGNIDPGVFLPLIIGTIIGVFVIGVIIACIHALIMFAYPLIVERRLSGMEAFKLSARAVFANLSGVVGLILCEFALGIIGYMVLCVGLYLVIPIMFAGVFVAYRKVFPPVEPTFTSPPPPPNFNQPPPNFANRAA
ncbi:MAG: hypothetical protein M3209_16840 [Acidobacteriota bacterium]|nr:hypothetical protein [Acidobacteriota bacterium]